MRIVNKEFFATAWSISIVLLCLLYFIIIMTDIFGLPFSDDDEEEYTTPMEDFEGDKENDNYVVLLKEIMIYRF